MSKLNTIIDTVIKHGSSSLTGILHRSKLHNEHNYDTSVNGLNLEDLVERCREEIGWSEHKGKIPAPEFFEQVAILSRKSMMFENEIAICKMYIDLVYKHAVKFEFSEEKIKEEVKPRCIPFIKRIQEAKSQAA